MVYNPNNPPTNPPPGQPSAQANFFGYNSPGPSNPTGYGSPGAVDRLLNALTPPAFTPNKWNVQFVDPVFDDTGTVIRKGYFGYQDGVGADGKPTFKPVELDVIRKATEKGGDLSPQEASRRTEALYQAQRERRNRAQATAVGGQVRSDVDYDRGVQAEAARHGRATDNRVRAESEANSEVSRAVSLRGADDSSRQVDSNIRVADAGIEHQRKLFELESELKRGNLGIDRFNALATANYNADILGYKAYELSNNAQVAQYNAGLERAAAQVAMAEKANAHLTDIMDLYGNFANNLA